MKTYPRAKRGLISKAACGLCKIRTEDFFFFLENTMILGGKETAFERSLFFLGETKLFSGLYQHLIFESGLRVQKGSSTLPYTNKTNVTLI